MVEECGYGPARLSVVYSAAKLIDPFFPTVGESGVLDHGLILLYGLGIVLLLAHHLVIRRIVALARSAAQRFRGRGRDVTWPRRNVTAK